MSKRAFSTPVQAPVFRKTKIAAAVAAVSGLCAVPAAGEDAGAQPSVEEIIVTARKREQNIQDTPVSIQAFTSDDIDRLDISRFEDFADQSASISYISVGPGTQVMHIRGVSDGGIPHVFRTNAATTAYYLDEQPVSGRNGGAPDLHLYDIERIEVLRGPEGTYYGASAVSGTVRIISKKPNPEQFEYGADLTGGSISDGDTTYTAEGYVNVPLSDRAALRGVFWYDKSNGFIDNPRSEFTFRNGVTVNNDRYAGEDYNEEETQGGRVSLLVDITDNWNATLSAFTQSLDAVGSWNHDPRRRGDLEVTRFGPEWREVDSDQLGFTLSGETGIGDLIYAVSYYDRQDFAVNDYSDYVEYASFGAWIQQHACEDYYWYGFTGCADPRVHFDSEDDNRRISHELRLASKGDSGSRLNWLVGVFQEKSWGNGHIFWRMDHINFETGPAADYTRGAGVVPLPNEWWSCPGWKYEDYSTAFFGDVSWDFTDRLTVSAGMRHFRWEDGDDWGFNCGYPWESKGTFSRNEEAPEVEEQTYKFNVRYDISEDLLVYFAYGEGVRPGRRNPNVTHPEVPVFVEPDYTKSYEVGWKATLADGRVVLNGAAYMIDWDNFYTVLYDLLTVPFNFRRNVGGSTIQGVELDMVARINTNWTLTGGLAYNIAELEGDFATIARDPPLVYAEDGRRLAHTPEWAWTLGLRYDKAITGNRDVYGQATWSYTDERWNLLARQSEQEPVLLDAYSLLNLRAGINFRDGAWGAELFVNNATDERAEIFQNSGYYDPRITTNQPRTFGVRVRFRG